MNSDSPEVIVANEMPAMSLKRQRSSLSVTRGES